jgi:Lrp/AsnC family leucine-responsive transcriptional regulator
MRLDDKDHKIIEQLRLNSRSSVRDIAKATELRPSTVHERIKRLINEKVIERFTLKLNNEAIGESFIVFMLVSGTPTSYVGAPILSNPHIKEVFGVTGECDMLMKLKFKDVAEFNDFVIKFRDENKEVTKTVTMIGTVNLKEEL